MKCHCHYVFLLCFVFTVVISFSLHAMLPLLANKDDYLARFFTTDTYTCAVRMRRVDVFSFPAGEIPAVREEPDAVELSGVAIFARRTVSERGLAVRRDDTDQRVFHSKRQR